MCRDVDVIQKLRVIDKLTNEDNTDALISTCYDNQRHGKYFLCVLVPRLKEGKGKVGDTELGGQNLGKRAGFWILVLRRIHCVGLEILLGLSRPLTLASLDFTSKDLRQLCCVIKKAPRDSPLLVVFAFSNIMGTPRYGSSQY